MNFPKVTLPAIAVGSAIVNNLILLVVMVVIFLFLGHVPSWNLMFIFLLMPVIVVFAVGIGLFLGIVNVFIRDVEQVVPIVLQVLFWFTPIVYPITVIPEKYVRILLNPMFDIVDAYHKAIAYDVAPRLTAVPVTLVLGLILCGISLVVFRRANTEMADVL